jgi:hypothetical protein
VPAQKRLGTNEERAPAVFGEEPACRSEQRAVPAPVERALDLPAQDLELVAKDKDLNLRGVVGAMLRRDNGEEPTTHHIEE